MEIYIKETKQIKELNAIDYKGINWTKNLIDGAENSKFNNNIREMNLEQFEFWEKYIESLNLIEYTIKNLYESELITEEEIDRIYKNTGNDYSSNIDIIKSNIDQVLGEKLLQKGFEETNASSYSKVYTLEELTDLWHVNRNEYEEITKEYENMNDKDIFIEYYINLLEEFTNYQYSDNLDTISNSCSTKDDFIEVLKLALSEDQNIIKINKLKKELKEKEIQLSNLEKYNFKEIEDYFIKDILEAVANNKNTTILTSYNKEIINEENIECELFIEIEIIEKPTQKIIKKWLNSEELYSDEISSIYKLLVKVKDIYIN